MKPTSYKTGLIAETTCKIVLRLKFYRILATRYKTPFGEIDILAKRGNVIIAVEVKARKNFETAAESISPKQQSRIANALRHFMSHNAKLSNCSVRFDAMLVAPGKWPIHIKNAWMS